MRLGIVIPWFGRELKGGAEQQAWQIASRLSRRGHQIDVLTTCCRSHQDDWAANHLPAGCTEEPEGFVVRRFPVDSRDRLSFDRACAALLRVEPVTLKAGVSPASTEDSQTFIDELIRSAALLAFLEQQRNNYDWFIFLPYLYGPIIRGIEIVGERAALQPCLHDEPYAYLPQIAEAFRHAGTLLFNSEGELKLAVRLMGPAIWTKSHVVGEGVEVDGSSAKAAEARSHSRDSARYILYLGRKDPEKNVPLLLNAFARFRAVRPNSRLRLLLAGIGTAPIAPELAPHAEDLGLVSEPEKIELLKNCAALFQPSRNESFSRVMMEAWMYGKPVAAHERCVATATAVRAARGGWTAGDERDWARLFTEIDRSSDDALHKLGTSGRRYAEMVADWDRVIARYEEALSPVAQPALHGKPQSSPAFAINQFLPNLAYGDAISDHAVLIRQQLRALGYSSEIYARFIDPRVAHECSVFLPEALERSNAVIYHHSIGSEVTPHVLNFEGAKALVYHNITPAEYFEPYRPEFAEILRQGRNDLQTLAPSFAISVGDSTFNTSELEESGFERPSVLPICIDPAHWASSADAELMARLQNGRTNILFVGRIAPNKKQDRLIRAFYHYLHLDPSARLSLVGPFDADDPYMRSLRRLLHELGLEEAVELPGSIPATALHAYFRTADLFWSMSEHEGFCVPLVEAMWFELPVLAYKSSAVPETLGAGGLLLTPRTDLAEAAAAAHELVHDPVLRQQIIAAQRKERERFLPERGLKKIGQLADRLRSMAEANPRRSAGPARFNTHRESQVRPRVAFVVQRAGREVIGGAEALCLQVAERMSQHWDTEVLATCALDYRTWENHYPAGDEQIGSTRVRRFRVDMLRDVEHFDALSATIVSKGAGATIDEQETWMRAQGPISGALFNHLSTRGAEYDAVFFFGYLYATTYFGLPLVQDRAILVPLAHDEWTIHFRMWDKFFAKASGFVFQTPEERQFLGLRFRSVPLNGPVAGIGVDAPLHVDPDGFRERYKLDRPFLLYLGRIDESKGCGEMLAAFERLKRGDSDGRKLVLMGREVMPVPFDEDVVYLGSLSEEEKWNGLAACEWLLMPSAHESLSIALLEAWSVGRPVIVNARSQVLVGHCRRSGGGLWYDTPEQCEALIRNVNAATGDTLGQQGQDYVRKNYHWPRIVADYQAALATLLDRHEGARRRAAAVA